MDTSFALLHFTFLHHFSSFSSHFSSVVYISIRTIATCFFRGNGSCFLLKRDVRRKIPTIFLLLGTRLITVYISNRGLTILMIRKTLHGVNDVRVVVRSKFQTYKLVRGASWCELAWVVYIQGICFVGKAEKFTSIRRVSY